MALSCSGKRQMITPPLDILHLIVPVLCGRRIWLSCLWTKGWHGGNGPARTGTVSTTGILH